MDWVCVSSVVVVVMGSDEDSWSSGVDVDTLSEVATEEVSSVEV